MKYQNHITHYQIDADFHDYFENNPIEEHNIKCRYSQIFNWLKTCSHKLILEIGSGGGYAVNQINTIKTVYVPLDIPLNNLKGIKDRSINEIFPTSGDVYNLPFQNNCIESIILSEVLEHLDSPSIALKEISRVLSDEGLLVISVPYKEKITYQICVHCNKPTPTHAHFHSFDEKTMEEFLDKTGLRIERKLKVNNKFLSRISMMLKLNYFPFALWRGLDKIFNIIFPKPSHILFQLKKSATVTK